MSGVLIDNWNLQNLIQDITLMPDDFFSREYDDFLTAIVLWDKVYFPDNDMSKSWDRTGIDLKKYMKPLEDLNFFEEESNKIYEEYFPDKSKVIAAGAIRYSLLSDKEGLSYLPSKDRSIFLNENSDLLMHHRINNINNRKDSLKIFDRIVKTQFDELLKVYSEAKVSFPFPILENYIKYNANDMLSYFDVALQLKKEKKVIAYRKYMNKFEEKIKNGDFTETTRFIKDIQDLVNDILGLTEKQSVTVTGVISIVPSINFEYEFPIFGHKFHLNFLRTLAKYAFSGK